MRQNRKKSGLILYNGIELPTIWPPQDVTLDMEPKPLPPYLVSPPEIIPIDVGRQLFVDDFLIEQTTLKRTFHLAEYYPDNPVLAPDKPWESCDYSQSPKWKPTRGAPTAMVFSDGVWYDPKDKLFKMWYMGGYDDSTCYATSEDGTHWEKPILDVVPGTNKVCAIVRDSSTVWLDLEEKKPSRRYKMFYYMYHWLTKRVFELQISFSSDGIHWRRPIAGRRPLLGDRTTVFWNPFRKVWVFSLRSRIPEISRTRHYFESWEVFTGLHWEENDPVPWTLADKLDLPRPGLDMDHAQFYTLDCVAYESLIIGLFSVIQGHQPGRPKINELKVGFSRDGFHWHRPDRRAFIPVSEQERAWNYGNVQSAGGCCLVVGDKLYFYVSGRAGEDGSNESGVCSTGLATLRRDGFASMDAGEMEAILTTRPVSFSGKYLFINADTHAGEMRVEVLDEKDQVIAPFTRANCVPITADKTLQAVTWEGAKDLSALSGKLVKFRFHLRNGKLYSFWVSPNKSGASHGYVAAGGPGFTGPMDTVGSKDSS